MLAARARMKFATMNAFAVASAGFPNRLLYHRPEKQRFPRPTRPIEPF
jgi:hypothetical protein